MVLSNFTISASSRSVCGVGTEKERKIEQERERKKD